MFEKGYFLITMNSFSFEFSVLMKFLLHIVVWYDGFPCVLDTPHTRSFYLWSYLWVWKQMKFWIFVSGFVCLIAYFGDSSIRLKLICWCCVLILSCFIWLEVYTAWFWFTRCEYDNGKVKDTCKTSSLRKLLVLKNLLYLIDVLVFN